jgi:hypothetical protein
VNRRSVIKSSFAAAAAVSAVVKQCHEDKIDKKNTSMK